MLTPLCLNPDDIYRDDKDGLFKFIEGKIVPDGLMPPAKAQDPAQLSTVLARTLSMQDMLKAGVTIIIAAVNSGRPRVDDGSTEVILPRGALIRKYRNVVALSEMDPDFYAENKEKIPAASYVWQIGEDGKTAAVFASQINDPNSGVPFDKLYGNEALPFVDKAFDSLKTAMQKGQISSVFLLPDQEDIEDDIKDIFNRIEIKVSIEPVTPASGIKGKKSKNPSP